MSQCPEIVLLSHWFGHTPYLLECITPFFLERGYTIYHLTDKPVEAEAFFVSALDGAQECIRHIPMVSVEPETPCWGKDAQLCRVEAHWKGVQLALEKLYVDLGRKVGIFHTWVDLYSHEYLERRVIEKAMSAPWCGLYVHPAELRIFKTWKRRLLENARDVFKQGRAFPSRLQAFDVPMAKKIYFLDEDMPAKTKIQNSILKGPFPEWVDVRSAKIPDIENLLRKSEQKIICLCGFLDKRKGLLTLLRSVSQLSKDWFFLFAGPIGYDSLSAEQKKEVLEWEQNPPANVFFINRLLADQEINQAVLNSDIVYLAYENFFHSSNVQIKAAHFKKPIIAGPRHLIADRTRRFGMGWCLPEISEQAVSDLLNQIDKQEIQRVIDSARFEEFCQEHSPERLNECLEEISRLVG
jgi:glycosyltransferase involved in cell wall biosynthesis